MGPEILSWSSAFRRDHSPKIRSSVDFFFLHGFKIWARIPFIHSHGQAVGSKDKNYYINFQFYF